MKGLSPPPSADAIKYANLIMVVVFFITAYWVDSHREPLSMPGADHGGV